MCSQTPNLEDLHKTLIDASEIMAACIGVLRGSETPPDNLIEAASRSVDDLAEWRTLIKTVCEMLEETHVTNAQT